MSRRDPHRHWRDRALDAIEASEETRRFVAAMTFEDFAADPRTVKAVLANLAIIGEAINHIPEERLAAYPRVVWHQIRGARNVIAHMYFGIDLTIIWNTVQQDLPPLENALTHMRAIAPD